MSDLGETGLLPEANEDDLTVVGFGGEAAAKREDLSEDWYLRDAARIDYEGEGVPSVGGIPLLHQIGKGGMGVVYYGMHPRLQTEVAVKILPRVLLEQHDGMAERFLREARLAARIQSPHLVRVLDVDDDDATGCSYIVMEFVRGQSAKEWSRSYQPARQVPESAVLEIGIAVARGLQAAHRAGVVHQFRAVDD